MPKAGDDIVICVGRESIEALAGADPVRVGDGEYLIRADSYDYPYSRIELLEKTLRAIVEMIDDCPDAPKQTDSLPQAIRLYADGALKGVDTGVQ